MNATQTISEVVSVTPWSRQIYHDADSFWQESKGLHYAYIVYRTLRGDYKRIFQPDAVFYVGKSPAAYLKKVKTNKISDEDIRQWQRFLWNQAVVPLLIIKSRTQVHVYTAYTKPEKKDSEQRIQSILEDVAETLELDQLWTAIESGMIYKQKPDAFLRNNAVDQYLLNNLNDAAHQLAETQDGSSKKEKEENLKFAHHFLTRLLFVCYLIERGMIGKHFNDIEDEILKKLRPANHKEGGYFLSHLFNELKTPSKKRDALCRIFGYVKRMFNGSLFPDSIAKESDSYSDDFIQIVNNFLNCDEIRTGQRLLLGFRAFDFSVIPIETISAVYESFLGEQGKLQEAQGGGDSKRATGAYYTPLHLAELTVDIALENIEEITKKAIHKLKVLDPACGSGVFLVSLFGRMAESLYREVSKTKGIDWARKLKPKLNQLYGIDINYTACHITCFSLYLAFLEWLEPCDVEYLHEHGEKLPPLLANTEKDSWNTIHKGNLFDPNLSFEKRNFDIVIGNPPWVSGKNQKDKEFLQWQKNNPSKPCPSNQIAHGFMWEVPKYLYEEGVACLLLPAGVLFNKRTNDFQAEWLNSVTIERVINFSDLRHVLFSGSKAKNPCVSIRFRIYKPEQDYDILYENPKMDILSQKGGPVYIREEDGTLLHKKDILRAANNKIAPSLWKSHFWGSWRDNRLLSRLNELPKLKDLIGKPDSGKRLILGRGGESYKQSDVEKKAKSYKPWWNKQLQFIPSLNNSFLIVNPNSFISIPAEFSKLRRSPDERLFTNPKILISRGVNEGKIAYCNQPVYFSDSIQSIAALDTKDSDLLRFLTLVLNSDIAQYYLFHTSTRWAIERDVIYLHEIYKIPFFLPEESSDSKMAQEIVDKVADKIEEFEKCLEKKEWFGEEQERRDKSNKLRIELEPLIREYYNIDAYESMLIDDTLRLAVKSFHPRQDHVDIPTLRQAKEEECRTYTQTLCEMLNHFGKGSQFKVRGKVFKGMPYSVVHVSLIDRVSTSVPVSNAKEELVSIIKKMGSLLQNKKGGFVFCQNLKVFDRGSLYILKPMQMRFWSRTSALNDADEIAGAIIFSKRGN
jgi:type I restriction-modification system DNA methylase subunit